MIQKISIYTRYISVRLQASSTLRIPVVAFRTSTRRATGGTGPALATTLAPHRGAAGRRHTRSSGRRTSRGASRRRLASSVAKLPPIEIEERTTPSSEAEEDVLCTSGTADGASDGGPVGPSTSASDRAGADERARRAAQANFDLASTGA